MIRWKLVIFCIAVFTVIQSCSGKNRDVVEKSKFSNGEKEVVCFVYHRVGDHRYPSTNTSVNDFSEHLAYLSKENYTVLNFSQAISYLQSKEESVKKVAVITIDDGYQSFFKNGLPLLKKYDFPATLFINTETVGGGDYMDWKALETCLENKIEIGNHTHSHSFFLSLPEAKRYQLFKGEIELSQVIIERNLKIKPVVFSYPYGEFDDEMKRIVKGFGFVAAAAQNSGVVYAGGDLFRCPRFPMSESYAARAKFVEKLRMRALRIEKKLPEDASMTRDRKPVLNLTFSPDNLRLDQLQCFIQGTKCAVKFIDREKTTISIQSPVPVAKKRRILYTVTVPDNKGIWHWYSHVWYDPSAADE